MTATIVSTPRRGPLPSPQENRDAMRDGRAEPQHMPQKGCGTPARPLDRRLPVFPPPPRLISNAAEPHATYFYKALRHSSFPTPTQQIRPGVADSLRLHCTSSRQRHSSGWGDSLGAESKGGARRSEAGSRAHCHRARAQVISGGGGGWPL